MQYYYVIVFLGSIRVLLFSETNIALLLSMFEVGNTSTNLIWIFAVWILWYLAFPASHNRISVVKYGSDPYLHKDQCLILIL